MIKKERTVPLHKHYRGMGVKATNFSLIPTICVVGVYRPPWVSVYDCLCAFTSDEVGAARIDKLK